MSAATEIPIVYDNVPTILSRYASTALFLYDTLITLGDEIEYVWKAKWSTPKGLYLVVRYFGLATAIFSCGMAVTPLNSSFCEGFSIFKSTWLLISAAFGDALLLLRAIALLNDRRKLCLALKVGYGVTYTIELALLCYYVSHHAPNRQTGGEDYGGNLGCVITSLTNNDKGPSVADIILAGSIAPVVIFNVILLFLVFYNILPAYRRNVGGEYTPLYTAILRDGGMYFVLVTASAIAVALTPLVWYNRPDRNNLDVPWFMAISPVAASRLFLNLRASVGKMKEQDMPGDKFTRISEETSLGEVTWDSWESSLSRRRGTLNV